MPDALKGFYEGKNPELWYRFAWHAVDVTRRGFYLREVGQ